MNNKELKERFQTFWYIITALLAVLLLKLVFVQFVQTQKYEIMAKDNRIRLISSKAPRGEIFDRNGKILAKNKLVYAVELSYLDMKDQPAVVKKLAELMGKTYPEITVDYINSLIDKQKYRLFEPIVVMRDVDWSVVVRLKEHRQELPGMRIDVQPLRYYPETILGGHLLGYVHPIYDKQELEKHYDPENYHVGDLVGKDGIEMEYEKYLKGKDGARQVEVDAKGQPVQELITLKSTPGDNLYLTIDRDLQRVMDKTMDQVMTDLQKKNPKAKAGACVLIDVKTGGILAMSSRPALDPNAFTKHMDQAAIDYYFPQGSYNPLKPGAIQNRALQGVYPPGSTFKPITGMAALESGKLDPKNDYVTCSGAYWYPPHIKCWQVHGSGVNFFRGLAVSCNVFFQEAGRRAGVDLIHKVAEEFGLGQLTDIDLPYEKKGLLPSREWKEQLNSSLINRKFDRKRKELSEKYDALLKQATIPEDRKKVLKQQDNAKKLLEEQYRIEYNFNTVWQPFDTFNMSIGQGSNQFTVIQLANYVAALANNGKRMRPYVVDRIVTPSPSNRIIEKTKPLVNHVVDVDPKAMQTTREAMHAVAMPGGTASYVFSLIPPEISGGAKTGTAQPGHRGDTGATDYHGVFICFAPYNNPEIAFAGIVEYGHHGSTSSGLVAKALMEQYFHIKDHLADDVSPTVDEASVGINNPTGAVKPDQPAQPSKPTQSSKPITKPNAVGTTSTTNTVYAPAHD
ncbi:MAG: penicillin-binding protein 2 [Acidobacteriota bacterium]